MTKSLFLLLFISNGLLASVYTVKSGKWGDKSTWSSNVIPEKLDSVIISKNHQISLSLDTNFCKRLVVLGSIAFSSANKSLVCNDILLDENGGINSSVLGMVNTNKLTSNGVNNIEGVNLQVLDSVIVNGKLNFIRKSGVISLKTIDIRNTGQWQVIDDRSFEIQGNLINNGQFIAGKGTYLFNGLDTLKGNKISVHKMKVSKHLFVQDSLLLIEEAQGVGSAGITCLDSSFFELKTTPSNFKVDYLNLAGTNNTICFSRDNSQVIPKVVGGNFENILVKTQGSLVFNEEVKILKKISIHKGSILVLSNYLIELKASNQILKVLDGGTLFFDNYIGNSQAFLNGFKLKEWSKGSLLKIEDSNNIHLNEIQLGNLEVDITNEGAQLILNQDSLVISQNLKLGTKTKFDISGKSVSIGGDWIGGEVSNSINSEVIYNGSQTQKIGGFNYSTLKINNSSLDTLVFNGNYNVNKLKVLNGQLKIGSLSIDTVDVGSLSTLLIGGVDPVFNSLIINKGYIGIISETVNCTFYADIYNYSEFVNQTSSNHFLSGNVLNDGIFIGCDGSGCTWDVLENIKFDGLGFSMIPRLNILNFKEIINESNLEISHEISGNGKLVNGNRGVLKLGMNSDQIKTEIDAFTYSNNTLVYNGSNTQIIGDLSLGKYGNLSFEKTSTKQLTHHVFIENELIIMDSVTVNAYDKVITGTIDGRFNMKNNSKLVLGDPNIDFSTPFPLGFLTQNCNLSESSKVQYNAWKEQFINGAIRYGNLYLTDGTGSENNKLILNSDSLVVKGNLDIGESSVKLLLGDKYLRVEGNCLGAGDIIADNALIEFYGSCTGTGEYQLGISKVVYSGIGIQEAKNCNYYDVEIRKPSGSVNINAGAGEFVVTGELNLNKGVLVINGEKVKITGRTVINDQLVFASKIQEKRFNDIFVTSSGFLDNQYGVNIFCEGKIFNEGVWICKGGTLKLDNKNKNQTLLNKGEMIINALKVDKSGFDLHIEGAISVLDTLSLINADITLLKSEIFLGNKSYLLGESDSNQISGFESEFYHYVSIDTGGYENLAGLGLELNSNSIGNNILIRRFFLELYLDGVNSTIDHGFEVVFDSLILDDVTVDFKIDYFNYWFSPGEVYDYAVFFGDKNTGYHLIESKLDLSKKEVFGEISLSGEIVFSKEDLSVLPVQLIDFYAIEENNGVSLNWHVGSEWGVKEYRIMKNNYTSDEVLIGVVTVQPSELQEKYYDVFDPENSTKCYYILNECKANDDCKELKKIYYDSRTNHALGEIQTEIDLKDFVNNMQNNDWVQFYSVSGKLLFDIKPGDGYPELKKGLFFVRFSNANKKGGLKIMR